jgi:predicted ATP-binding protein involved in virulence
MRRIVEILVTDLFGIFNHSIPLNTDDRITIIHGPNGFGKTILLRMLDGVINGRYSELQNTPFRRFQVKFDDGSVIWVDKKQVPRVEQQSFFAVDEELGRKYQSRNGQPLEITVNFSKPNVAEAQSFPLVSIRENGFPLSTLEEAIPVTRIDRTEWLYHPTDEILSLEDILERFGHRLPSIPEEPDWWIEIRKLINIHLIETQRLLNIREARRYRYKDRKPQMVPTVQEYSEELAEVIKQKLTESAVLSQSLDRTFPARLVEQIGHLKLTDKELQNKLGELEKKRSRLKEVGLLDKEEDMAFLPTKEIVGQTKDVLAVYVEDTEKKLSIFDEIADKMELFKKIINERFLYKKISISKQEGFTFTTSEGKSLSPTRLSSGEQHELVLLYQLLFKVKPNSLILIDEPELSLHVAWQKQFLRDLQEITKLASFDILLATHSPQIIHDRWDLTVELKEPEPQVA